MSLHTLAVEPVVQTSSAGQLEELALGGSLLLFFLLLILISYLINVVLTLVVGAPLVAVAAEWLRGVERHASSEPVRSGAIGFGALLGGIVGFVVFALGVQLSIAAGLPEFLGTGVVLVGVVGLLGLFVLTAVGEILAGLVLLTRFGSDDEPSLWVALVVAAVVVNVAYLVPLAGSLLALALLSVATGAAADRWWQRRGDDAPPASPVAESVNN